jgi:hypothetical protein
LFCQRETSETLQGSRKLNRVGAKKLNKNKMANTKVEENHLTFGGTKYFRGHASAVSVGSCGEKNTPVLGQNYLDVKSRIPLKGIKIKAQPVSIDFSNASSADFGVDVTAIIKGVKTKLAGSVALSKLRSGDLQLLLLTPSSNDIKNAANGSTSVLDNLRDYSKERIASEVFIVIDAETSTTITNSTDVKITGSKDSAELKLSAKTSSTKTTNVTFPAGMCFAYMLLKVDWKMKFLKKDYIEDLDMDPWSM